MGTHSCGHTSSHKKKCRTQAIQSSGKGRRSPSHDVPAHAPPRLCPRQNSCRVCPVSGWLRAFEHVATVVRETAAVKDGSRARAWGIRGQARTQQLRPSGDEKKAACQTRLRIVLKKPFRGVEAVRGRQRFPALPLPTSKRQTYVFVFRVWLANSQVPNCRVPDERRSIAQPRMACMAEAIAQYAVSPLSFIPHVTSSCIREFEIHVGSI